jgi:hypothetical protein
MMGGFTQRATGDATRIGSRKTTFASPSITRSIRSRAKLVALSNGDAFYEDELPPAELLRAANITIKGDRQSYKRIVTWYKFTAFEELDKRVLPGRWIPVVPVYGVNIVVGGKRMRFGAVRFAKDPQRMVNFWQTAITEGVALAAKAKWLMAEGQDEGFENEWAQANREGHARPALQPRGRGRQARAAAAARCAGAAARGRHGRRDGPRRRTSRACSASSTR